jgi:DNA repair exonuclease SbcCD ATPase subunit
MLYESFRGPFFRSIHIEGFRGFNIPIDIDLDGSAIILAGANGRGKTSLTDAIQWLILGTIPRLHELRVKQNEEHIVNKYAESEGRQALVRVVLSLDGNQDAVITRQGNYRDSALEIRLGAGTVLPGQADQKLCEMICGSSLAPGEMNRYMLSMALLQQDVVRAFISDDTGDSRYTMLSRLLGLESLTMFVEQLDASLKPLRERERNASATVDETKAKLKQLDRSSEEWEARVSVLNSYHSCQAALDEIASRGDHFRKWAEAHASLAEAQSDMLLGELRSIDADIALLRDWVDQAVGVFRQRPVRMRPDIERELAEVASSEETLRLSLVKLQTALDEAQQSFDHSHERAELVSQLAAAAIPLLTEVCPVCQQAIDARSVAARLTEALQMDRGLEQAAAVLEAARANLFAAKGEVGAAENNHQAVERELRKVLHWERQVNEQNAARVAAVRRLLDLHVSVPDFLQQGIGDTQVEDWCSAMVAWLADIGEAIRDALKSLQQIASEEALAQYRRDQDRVNASIVDFKLTLDSQLRVLESLRKDIEDRKRLVSNARVATNTVVEETFGRIEPVFRDLFERLAPHPTFGRLSLTHEIYRSKGVAAPMAYDDKEGRTINPAIGFSSAQTNVAALCYFLAFAFSGSEIRFPFVILDDPLQSMDDINILAFADLCRFLRQEKQLMISTHDDRLASLLVRKLTPRRAGERTIQLQFMSWDRSGPKIEYTRIEQEPVRGCLVKMKPQAV